MVQSTFDDILKQVLFEQIKQTDLTTIASNLPTVFDVYYPEKNHIKRLQESISDFQKNQTVSQAAELIRIISYITAQIPKQDCEDNIKGGQLALLEHIKSFIPADMKVLAAKHTRDIINHINR